MSYMEVTNEWDLFRTQTNCEPRGDAIMYIPKSSISPTDAAYTLCLHTIKVKGQICQNMLDVSSTPFETPRQMGRPKRAAGTPGFTSDYH